MTHGKLLRQLIRSGAEGDLDAFRGVAKQVIAEQRQKRQLLANDLKTILYGRVSDERPTTTRFMRHEVIHGVVDRLVSDSFRRTGGTVAAVVPLFVTSDRQEPVREVQAND